MDFVPDPAYCREYRVLPYIPQEYKHDVIPAAAPCSTVGKFGVILQQFIKFDILSIWYHILKIDRKVLLHPYTAQPIFPLNFVTGDPVNGLLGPDQGLELGEGQFQLLSIPAGKYEIMLSPGTYRFLHIDVIQFLLQEFLHEYGFIKDGLVTTGKIKPSCYRDLSLSISIPARVLVDDIIGNRQEGVKGRLSIEHAAKKLLLLSLDQLQQQHATGKLPKQDQQLLNDAAGYIVNRLDQKITVANLCRHLSISRTRLYVLFREAFGMGIHDYILAQKIEKARVLLQQGLAVSVVAARTGYSEAGNFTRIFKQHTGVNPSDYRAT